MFVESFAKYECWKHVLNTVVLIYIRVLILSEERYDDLKYEFKFSSMALKRDS